MERCGLVMWEEPSLSGLSSFCFSPLLPSHSNKRGLGWIMCEGLIRGSCAYLLACYRDVAMSL
uniref:Uncharacterized protein n=1 Tax=Arundo donax TaxID=35708 RepID=A0A0A8ZTU1_ARUDO